ncbi:hypothetical protein ACFJIW_15215 [Tahibacter sp. UC22_41]|uniref:hypothetical protein n=1 Tax=Tahibacter sp. UC22_41 TaxID=3350178 RepID=UPI0036DF63C4
MSWNPSSIVVFAQDSLRDSGIVVSRGHLFEVFAALHSFRTYAAYRAVPVVDELLPSAEIVCFDKERARKRAIALSDNAADAEAIVEVVLEECKAALGETDKRIRVYSSANEFFDDEFSSSDFHTTIMLSGPVNSEFSDTNAYMSDCEVEEIDELCELAYCDGEWNLVVMGKVYGDQDPDRMYWGDTVEFRATVTYTVIAGVGLIFDDMHVEASVLHEVDLDK